MSVKNQIDTFAFSHYNSCLLYTSIQLVLKSGTLDSEKEWFAVGDYKKRPNMIGDMIAVSYTHLVADTIRCSLSLWTTPQSIFLCNGFLNACLYPPKRKSYVLSTSVLDFIAFDFWINEKAATLHHERQEDSLPL